LPCSLVLVGLRLFLPFDFHFFFVYCNILDNIKIELREIGWDGMDLLDLAQDRDHWGALVNTVMNLRVP
jgi:hypothetical protein